MDNAIYLGDGVYAQLDTEADGIILTTGSHVLTEATNTIYLEPAVLGCLENWLAFMKAQASNQVRGNTK